MSIHYFDESVDTDIDVTIKPKLYDVGTHISFISTRIGLILSVDNVYKIQVA